MQNLFHNYKEQIEVYSETSIAQGLLNLGNSANITDPRTGRSLLHIAIMAHRLPTVESILQQGTCDKNDQKGHKKLSAAHFILYYPFQEEHVRKVLQLLVKYKCDLNVKDERGRTMLAYAAMHPFMTTDDLNFLITKGNAQVFAHTLYYVKSAEMLHFLLQKYGTQGTKNWTLIIAHATTNCCMEEIHNIMELCPPNQRPHLKMKKIIYRAIQYCKYDRLQEVLRYYKITPQYLNKIYALHFSAQFELANFQLVLSLLPLNAIHSLDKQKQYPLDIAIRQKNIPVAMYLFELKARYWEHTKLDYFFGTLSNYHPQQCKLFHPGFFMPKYGLSKPFNYVCYDICIHMVHWKWYYAVNQTVCEQTIRQLLRSKPNVQISFHKVWYSEWLVKCNVTSFVFYHVPSKFIDVVFAK